MGCDIHAYIDYDAYTRKDGTSCSVQFADVCIFRDYTVFALMAGVRYYPNEYPADFHPLFEPRGFLDTASWTTRDKYCLYVIGADREPDHDECTRESAERWVENHQSQWMDKEHNRVSHPDWHTPSWLTVAELEQVQAARAAVEFYEASWYGGPESFTLEHVRRFDKPDATPDDIHAELMTEGHFTGLYYVRIGKPKPIGENKDLAAVIAAMKALNGDDPNRSRLVFWFDN